jgi:pimeloyl-ACP methyl ester carboxylesterase
MSEAQEHPAYQERRVPFTAGDGFPLNLINVRGSSAPTRPPVLLVHGAGVRANIFRAPVKTTLVDALIADGYDVWLENWRASIEHPPNPWTLDEAALHDHPLAVQKIVEETGSSDIKAVIHCQGSTSFMMSAMAGLIPEVTTIVSNAVSLHPVVPRWSVNKLRYAVPTFQPVMPYLNPQWGDSAPGFLPKLVTSAVLLAHHECDNPVCKMVSFVYGSGFPALWEHENLNEATHNWLSAEFGAVPMTFFRHIDLCERNGSLVNVIDSDRLPKSYVDQAPRTKARFGFLAGALNKCFLAESQERTFAYFEQYEPGYHSLHVFPTYSHLDIFMGKNAADDVFPTILRELAN